MASVEEAKALICEMCRNFYAQGWVSGTGGGMSIKVGDRIVMAPSGVQKERMREADMFVLDAAGEVLETPEARPPPHKPPKLSECSPLFMAAYELRGAGAVLHSHSLNAVAATLLQPGNPGKGGCVGEFRVTNLEMIKGIAGHGYFDTCTVPVIENTARECELTESLRAAMRAYPRANAVLVRRHGVYVWGDTWIQAKTQAECYEYLFEAALKLRSLGLDVSRAPAGAQPAAAAAAANGHVAQNGSAESAAKRPRLAGGEAAPAAVVLDIEGTVAPISFVAETLFPYARQRLRQHLSDTWASEDTQADLALLRQEAAGQPLASADPADKEATVTAAVAFAERLMDADVKSPGLKALQGRVWHAGFASGALQGALFPDVLPALRAWAAAGVRVYIYSSGSRLAQRDLFAHTAEGDVRPLLAGFFDTSIGPKVEAKSYRELALTLGADAPSQLLFATDSAREAAAATAAGWRVALTVRPGNAPLAPAEAAQYRVVHSLAELQA